MATPIPDDAAWYVKSCEPVPVLELLRPDKSRFGRVYMLPDDRSLCLVRSGDGTIAICRSLMELQARIIMADMPYIPPDVMEQFCDLYDEWVVE